MEQIRVSDLCKREGIALKKYVIWVSGFNYYAGGITGVTRWSYLKIRNKEGWDSRPEAWEYCKKQGIKQYSKPAQDPYGKGNKAQSVRIMRLDKFIKYIQDPEKSWYERQTYTIPDCADVVEL